MRDENLKQLYLGIQSSLEGVIEEHIAGQDGQFDSPELLRQFAMHIFVPFLVSVSAGIATSGGGPPKRRFPSSRREYRELLAAIEAIPRPAPTSVDGVSLARDIEGALPQTLSESERKAVSQKVKDLIMDALASE